MNNEYTKENRHGTSILDWLRAYRGQLSVMEAFLAKEGIFLLTLVIDEKGKEFFYKPAGQTCYRVIYCLSPIFWYPNDMILAIIGRMV